MLDDLPNIDCNWQVQLAALHNKPGYNLITPGLSYRCKADDYLANAGFYRNSNGNSSAYIYAGKNLVEYEGVKLGVVAAAVTGYSKPVVFGPIMLIEYKDVTITVTPPTKRGVIAVGISYNF